MQTNVNYIVGFDGKYYIIGSVLLIGAKYYKWYILRYSSGFMAAILKIGIRTPLGILNGFLARSNDLKKKVCYIIG